MTKIIIGANGIDLSKYFANIISLICLRLDLIDIYWDCNAMILDVTLLYRSELYKDTGQEDIFLSEQLSPKKLG